MEARERWLDERDAFLDASLEAGERVVARSGTHPVVTDRRILDAIQLRSAPHAGDWVLDPLLFADVTRWSMGQMHDRRPLLRLEHHPLTRMEDVPARRFLWFRWCNGEGPATRPTTTLGFGRDTDPVLVAILTELDDRRSPQDQPFVIRPAGDRAERVGSGTLFRESRTAPIRFGLWRVAEVVYRRRLGWPVRLLSWTLLGVPAWFITPWLVLPAIAVAELAWIAFLQWSWRQEQARQRILSARVREQPRQPAP